MTTGYQIKEQDKLHFVTLQVVEWIDIFSREVYRKIIIENLEYCIKNKGLVIYAWVIMSNHVHLLLREKQLGDISTIMKRLLTKYAMYFNRQYENGSNMLSMWHCI